MSSACFWTCLAICLVCTIPQEDCSTPEVLGQRTCGRHSSLWYMEQSTGMCRSKLLAAECWCWLAIHLKVLQLVANKFVAVVYIVTYICCYNNICRLDYCNTLLAGAADIQIKQLQPVQNSWLMSGAIYRCYNLLTYLYLRRVLWHGILTLYSTWLIMPGRTQRTPIMFLD